MANKANYSSGAKDGHLYRIAGNFSGSADDEPQPVREAFERLRMSVSAAMLEKPAVGDLLLLAARQTVLVDQLQRQALGGRTVAVRDRATRLLGPATSTLSALITRLGVSAGKHAGREAGATVGRLNNMPGRRQAGALARVVPIPRPDLEPGAKVIDDEDA